MGASPRQQIVHDAAASAIKEEGTLGSQVMSKPSLQHFRQPMPLLMQIFNDLSDKNEDFWFRIAPFFAKETIPAGTILWNQGVILSFFQANSRTSHWLCIYLKVVFFEHPTTLNTVSSLKRLLREQFAANFLFSPKRGGQHEFKPNKTVLHGNSIVKDGARFELWKGVMEWLLNCCDWA
jgi:hypothetical protein